MVVFACQRDSFQKEFITKIVSCKPAKIPTEQSKDGTPCYEVICEDTILFPEGGGQPYDLGEIDSAKVLKVLRRGAEAVHYVDNPLEEGATVKQTIDWTRRLDHMQQHSGQHLLTAITDMMFGYETTSWWLGDEVSHIELNTGKLTQNEVNQIEEAVNEKIRLALPVKVEVLSHGDPSLDDSRTRGLPKDHVGDVRIVTICSIESNMCCGTHVSNLAELQVIKLLAIEKGKKGKINLQFLVGNRVTSRLDKMFRRELELNLLLKNGPDLHVSLVDKLIKSNKTANKNLQVALKEVALLEITKFKALDPKPKFLHIHKKDAEMDFVNFFIREFKDEEVLLFLAIGEGDEGHVVLHGPEDLVSKLGPQIAQILDGKGNGKQLRFQAKVKNLKLLPSAVQLCQDALK